jgi:adenylate kinase
MKLIILGPPGAGKGTQAATIVDRYNVVHISTGDIFRANLREGTPLGLEAKGYMDKGELVPDELTVKMVIDRIGQPDCEAGYMLDGFPRSITQADALRDAGEKIDVALNIAVDNALIVDRIVNRVVCPKCGAAYNLKNNPPKVADVCDECGETLYKRDDDNEETVATRLAVYDENTAPLIDYYEAQGVLRSVDGNASIQEVSSQIALALDEFKS